MAGINFIRRWVMGQMKKRADDGIMITLPDSNKVDLNVSITMDRLIRNGIDPDQITNPQQVDNAINMINSRMVNRAIPADSAEGREITEKLFGKQKAPVFDMEGNRIPEDSGIMGGKSLKNLMESGQVTKGARGMDKSKKVQDREMFQAANERLTSDVDTIVKNIKRLSPMDAMKEANLVIGRKGYYKNLSPEESKKILKDTEDHIFERDIPETEDFALGGRAGLRFGGDTMGGRNDRSKSSSGPDRSRVSDRQQANHDRAMSDRSNEGNRNYSPLKQIAKKAAINTAKNLGTKKLMNVLGLSKFSNPIGIAMVLRNAYKQAKNPVFNEEDLTLGLITDTQKDIINKQGKIGQLTGAFDPEATFDAAKMFDDKGSSGIFGVGATKPEPMTREEYDDYVNKKNFAAGGIAGMLGERPRYQTGGDVAYDASDASVYGSSAITVTPGTTTDQFGNQVQSQMGNNYNPGGGVLTINPGVNVPPELINPVRPPGGGPTPPQTLPDGTPYNPGRPIEGPPVIKSPGLPTPPPYDPGFPRPGSGNLTMNPGGGRPIGGGPSPYAGPIKSQNDYFANQKLAPGADMDKIYQDYVQKHQDYNAGTQQGVMPRPGPAIDPNNPLLQSEGRRPPIGGGPSPYEGSMKTQDEFGANAFFKSQQAFDDAYSNYQKGYQDYNRPPDRVTDMMQNDPRFQPGNIPGTDVPYSTLRGGGNLLQPGGPGDPRLGAQQIEGNQLQMMMRGSGPAKRMPTAPAIIDIPEMQATQPSLRQLEAQPMPFASPYIDSSPIGQAAGMANGGRAGFAGGGMGRRGFLKLLGSLGAGAAAFKTGILGLGGKQAGKEVAKEVVKQSTSTPPPYFFKLAEKIKNLGDDVTATTDRTISKSLKSKNGTADYILEEDMVTGDTLIKKINKEGDEMITDIEIMELRKGEVVRGPDGKPVKTPDSYEEVTEANARIEGDVFNDPYYTDGIKIDDIMREVGEQAPSIKKASGGIARMLGE